MSQSAQLLKKIRAVTFFGYSASKPTDKIYKDAYETSRLVAEYGANVVNGGFGGEMEAASSGAHDGGGQVTAVTYYPESATNFEAGKNPNPYIDREVVTHSYLERTLKLIEMGDAFVIFKGGTGTISEFGMAWGLARIYFGHHKPMVLYGEFWEDIIETFKEHMLLRPEEMEVYKIVTTPLDAIKALVEFDDQMVEQSHNHKEKNKREVLDSDALAYRV